MDTILTQIEKGQPPYQEELSLLLSRPEGLVRKRLAQSARRVCEAHYGKAIYIRGLIEFTNYCKNDCYYCGIRASNRTVERYRLTAKDILSSCEVGYRLGFRTFVLQGGEDPRQTDDFIEQVVRSIRQSYPDVAITLSLGEKSEEAYRRFFQAGANRYLLRHETYSEAHYKQLHPERMIHEHRINAILSLKAIGYQTGTGIMVGSPYQTDENIVDDIFFIVRLRPEMIGLGPFIPHRETPFRQFPAGSLDKTLLVLATLRIMHPKALIPSTTALATLHPEGRLRGILAGCNVVMPNLSPADSRSKYSLYNDKAAFGAESAEGLSALQKELNKIGYEISYERGDF